MRRLLVLGLSTVTLFVAGCGVASYESRLEKTLNDRKYQLKLNENLSSAPQEKYKEARIWVRPPKALTKAPTFLLTPAPGQWEIEDSYSGAPTPEKVDGNPAPALPPMRMHILARVKPKDTKKKKGEEPEPPKAERGKFIDDVRNLLSSELGPEAATSGLKDETKRGRRYKRLIFKGSNGDDIQVYFAETGKGEIETALIFDIPPALSKLKIATTGIELCLESYAAGPEAGRMFSGGAQEEDSDGAISPGGVTL